MEIWNADGSQVEMCANGIRAFYKYLRDHGHTDRDEIGVETLSGVVRPRWAGADRVTRRHGPADPRAGEDPDHARARRRTRARRSARGRGRDAARLLGVDGQPARRDLRRRSRRGARRALGPRIEHHPAFPNRVNVEFVRVLDRGARFGSAPGSAARARRSPAGAVRARWPWYPCCEAWSTARCTIELRGGVLEISWPADDAHVEMTGPAAEVFTGCRSGSRGS